MCIRDRATHSWQIIILKRAHAYLSSRVCQPSQSGCKEHIPLAELLPFIRLRNPLYFHANLPNLIYLICCHNWGVYLIEILCKPRMKITLNYSTAFARQGKNGFKMKVIYKLLLVNSSTKLKGGKKSPHFPHLNYVVAIFCLSLSLSLSLPADNPKLIFVV